MIEVAFALAILAAVLVGASVVASLAFRSGQTARERTQVSDLAQQQMEALRSFRDNHTWDEFRGGNSGTYAGVDTAGATPCTFDAAKHCFHMELKSTAAGTTEWVPVAGPLGGPAPGVAAWPVAGAVIEIWADDGAAALAARPCDYDFEAHYSIPGIGGSTSAQNHIRTRLTNLRYQAPPAGASVCL